jgi:hypothetical protein
MLFLSARLRRSILAVCLLAWPVAEAAAQGVTTGSLTGIVTDSQMAPVSGASVIAIHAPSGTTYETTTRSDGRFSMLGMRVGSPYIVTIAYTGTGTAFEPQTVEDVEVNLGVATDLNLIVKAIAVQETVTVIGQSDTVFSSNRTGAATAVLREQIATLPNLTNRLDNFTRLTPQAAGMSMAGQDPRMNNITVDGSYFNNSFGLGNTPGDRTGVAPISPQAVEQIQVNVAPFDVRQGNFVGAGINTVTRSGTNQFVGSVYHQFRDQDQVGTKAKDLDVNPGTFDFSNTGVWGGGPILRNKAFFFGNFEDEELTRPGTTFRANNGGETPAGAVTRVLASDLQRVSDLMRTGFNYETGPWQDYDFLVPAKRYLIKGDWNLNASNKFTFRYTQLDSTTDVLMNNSSSLGFGSRQGSLFSMNFANSNYVNTEYIKSGIGEWNSVIGSNMSNSLIVGYNHSDESREPVGAFFPMVDILAGDNTTYMGLGFEPFSPNNELRYGSFQLQDNFTRFSNKHTLTFGGTLERYESENIFFPGSQSVYVYNTLDDFITDVNGYLANPNRTTSTVNLRRFQVRYNNIPGQDKPVQPLEVFYSGAYAQDEWSVLDNLKLMLGLRFDVPVFGDTGYRNELADALVFRDEDGQPVQYETAKLPDPKILWSPRAGFNWNLDAERRTQVRGGTGVFTGRPAYVWISNQIGNTGVLTGFDQFDQTATVPLFSRPFSPDPNRYKPTNVTGAPAASYELALTDENFKFPQVWRTNIAIDRRLPWGMTGTAEYIYSSDVNGVYYINANLPAAQAAFTGVDNRPRYTSNRIHSNVTNAIVLKNQDVGDTWNLAFSGTKTFPGGFFKTAYSYGEAKNTVDPGSIAFGSWNNNQHPGDPNNPGIGYASGSPGHRFFLTGSYSKEYFRFGATTFSAFLEARQPTTSFGGPTNTSYVFSGDLNGDGGTTNDLIYIPRDRSEMNFQTYTQNNRTYTAEEQAAAWEALIAQDDYLSQHRGEYAQRGAVFLPLVKRLDFNIAQDLFATMKGRRHAFQFRVDFINFGNLLNSDWGVAQRLVSNSPLLVPTAAQGGPVDTLGRAQYRLRLINNEYMTRTLEQTADANSDVWRIQFMIRYTFN